MISDLALAPEAGWRVIVAALKTHPVVVALWAEFSSFAEGLSDALGAANHAFSVEFCVDSWEAKKIVRVHCHLYLNGERGKLRLSRASLAGFKGSLPHRSHKVAALNNRGCSGMAGCYYLVCPKISVVYQDANVRPYKDFGVSAEWITNMVQAEKMEFKDARLEMTRCGKGFTRRMAELKAWEAAKKEIALQARVDAERAYHAAHNKAFRKFPKIDAWLVKNTKPHMKRKQILVLTGESGLGKTEYLKALLGSEDACLELNAQNMEVPVLLGFDADEHKLVFWDECKVQLVLDNRKLFQCPAAWIQLGFSPTGRDMYKVWLNEAVMAIGSNSWAEQVDALKCPTDQRWIVKNTLVVHVESQMWID